MCHFILIWCLHFGGKIQTRSKSQKRVRLLKKTLPVGEAVFGGGAPEGVAPPAASEIVTMPPSPEVTEVFVMAACPFPMAVSSAAEAEIEFEATVVILESETVLEGAPTI